MAMDKIWEKIHKTQNWGGYPTEHVIRFVARNYYCGNRSKTKILDFGCGAGNHAWYLAREGFDTYAFDGSKYAVENAEKKLSSENLSAHFAVLDGINISYEDNFFDAVIDNVCICSNILSDIKQMYQNIFRVLKGGGKLLTVCFGTETYGYGLGKEVENGTFTEISDGPLHERGNIHFYEKSDIKSILEDIGFKVLTVDVILYTDNEKPIQQYIVQAEKLQNAGML